jgi:uncharacterized membrane protein
MQNPPPNYSAPGAGAGTGKSSTGLDANVAALIAYIFTFLSGLIFFLIEKESRYVRFHAMQALLLGAGFFILWIVLVIVNITLAFASGTLATLMGLISFLIWLPRRHHPLLRQGVPGPVVQAARHRRHGREVRRQVRTARTWVGRTGRVSDFIFETLSILPTHVHSFAGSPKTRAKIAPTLRR